MGNKFSLETPINLSSFRPLSLLFPLSSPLDFSLSLSPLAHIRPHLILATMPSSHSSSVPVSRASSAPSLSTGKIYVVFNGRKPGIYTNWCLLSLMDAYRRTYSWSIRAEAALQVNGFPSQIHKSYKTRELASAAWDSWLLATSKKEESDGAFLGSKISRIAMKFRFSVRDACLGRERHSSGSSRIPKCVNPLWELFASIDQCV